MSIDVKKKVTGLLVPVFALRREGDLGIGDTLAFIDAIKFCARNRLSILQTLPVNETSGDNSPYNAISSMALESCLLAMTPEMVPGLTGQMVAEAQGAAAGSIIDYQQVKSVKHDLLRRSFENFSSAGGEHEGDFKEFVERSDFWLSPYAVFRTIVHCSGGDTRWTEWPEDRRNYESARDWLVEHETADNLASDMSFFCFVQWVADRQWRKVREEADRHGVRLMGDIPFGVSRFSADVWHRQDLFDLEWSGGAPPEPVFHGDLFTKNWGQNWGIPVYKWDAHHKENFQWWRLRIQRLLEHFHDFRIDHVLGFFRVYAFPWTPERNGEFVELDKEEAASLTGGRLPCFLPRDDERKEDARKNCREGVDILTALADAAPDSSIVAEDLGIIVPPYLRPAIHELGMAGFAIPLFEREEETREFKEPDELHPLSLATYATHDHEPLAAVYKQMVERWQSADGHEGWLEMQRLMRFLGLDEENPPRQFSDELHEVFIKTLIDTPCWAAVFMITDVLGTSQRFNQPGLSGLGCWTERLELSLAQYEKDSRFGLKIERLRNIIGSSDRTGAARLTSAG